MTGIVLAGGRNARMGCDKSTLPWQSSDFLHTILHKLATVCTELIVVSNRPPLADLPDVRFVSDIIPQLGPLSGIHAGLTHATSQCAFITACDMPFLQPAAVSWMFSQMQDWDVIAPGDDHLRNPCLPAMPKPVFLLLKLCCVAISAKPRRSFNIFDANDSSLCTAGI